MKTTCLISNGFMLARNNYTVDCIYLNGMYFSYDRRVAQLFNGSHLFSVQYSSLSATATSSIFLDNHFFSNMQHQMDS